MLDWTGLGSSDAVQYRTAWGSCAARGCGPRRRLQRHWKTVLADRATKVFHVASCCCWRKWKLSTYVLQVMRTEA